jgi:hypothetical protein
VQSTAVGSRSRSPGLTAAWAPLHAISRTAGTDGSFGQCARAGCTGTAGLVRAYALVDLGDHLAIDVFLRREDAFAAVEDAVADEAQWAGLLYVEPIELDERAVSAN